RRDRRADRVLGRSPGRSGERDITGPRDRSARCAVRHARPGGIEGSGSGLPPGAGRIRLPGPIRDRGRAGVRDSGRRPRHGGAPARSAAPARAPRLRPSLAAPPAGCGGLAAGGPAVAWVRGGGPGAAGGAGGGPPPPPCLPPPPPLHPHPPSAPLFPYTTIFL